MYLQARNADGDLTLYILKKKFSWCGMTQPNSYHSAWITLINSIISNMPPKSFRYLDYKMSYFFFQFHRSIHLDFSLSSLVKGCCSQLARLNGRTTFQGQCSHSLNLWSAPRFSFGSEEMGRDILKIVSSVLRWKCNLYNDESKKQCHVTQTYFQDNSLTSHN